MDTYSDKGGENYKKRKDSLLPRNGKLLTTGKIMKLVTLSHHAQNKLKMDQRPKYKTRNYKTPGYR